MMSLWVTIVRAIHILVIMIIVISPFYAEQLSLTTYVILLPFIVLHWVSMDNTCVLTLLERKFRQSAGEDCKDDDLFIGSLISPVYDVHKLLPNLSNIIYISTLLLWLIAVFRLRSLYISKGLIPMLQPSRM